jgi:hypothetical protein
METIRFGKKQKIEFDEYLKELGLQSSSVRSTIEDPDLLESFWDNNQRFLLAVMSGMNGIVEGNEKAVLDTLLSDSSKRDTTKYRVYYNGKCLNKEWLNDKGANNGETAWLIVKAWLEKKNEDGCPVDIEYLNKEFKAGDCNSYYSGRKWLKKLFYLYSEEGKYVADGNDHEGVIVDAGGWDFYKPKNENDLKFQLKLGNGTNIIMLKMWRKDDLRKLYDHVKRDDGIDVQPTP